MAIGLSSLINLAKKFYLVNRLEERFYLMTSIKYGRVNFRNDESNLEKTLNKPPSKKLTSSFIAHTKEYPPESNNSTMDATQSNSSIEDDLQLIEEFIGPKYCEMTPHMVRNDKTLLTLPSYIRTLLMIHLRIYRVIYWDHIFSLDEFAINEFFY